MRPATYFESMIEHLANTVSALSKAFDRAILNRVTRAPCGAAGQRYKMSEPRTPQEGDCHRAEDLRPGRSAP